MEGVPIAILVLFGVLVARGYVRSRPPTHEITLRERALVGFTAFAVACLAFGAAVAFHLKFAPEVTLLERIARGLTVAGIGLAPLALFLLVARVLRLVRRWENARRARHSS